MIILDTNVVSELMKPAPEPAVVGWVRSMDDGIYLTTITVAEIFYGLQRLPMGRRRAALEATAESLIADFADFVLVFDRPAARRYGDLVAGRDRAGKPISTEDAQIAAICLVSGMSCATRNTSDFEDLSLELINPWTTVG